MRHAIASIVFAVATASGMTAPVYAQTDAVVVPAPVTQDQVTSGCTGADVAEASCRAIIAQYVAYLLATGADQAAIDAAMTNLVVALGEAEVPAVVRAIIVVAVREIATTYVSPDVQVAIAAVAEAIEEAGEGTPATGSSPA